mmetsp:Transcript_26902/g.80645  ORF Transcript_26902/g.80645 Transcript_26902/m.80645 type:complete len:264 (+) Transcript_26902:180-971(+)
MSPAPERKPPLALTSLVLLALVLPATGLAAGKRRRKPAAPNYLELLDGADAAWQCGEIIETINRGGVGVLPTDTGYAFVARVDSKDAVARLLEIKGDAHRKKPLALLCRDLATIDTYTRFSSRAIFKVLKRALPGPYTFILPASEALPRQLLKNGKRQWKRNTVGVRIPADDVCAAVLAAVDAPLFCSSVPVVETDDDEYLQLVCAGPLEGDHGGWCSLVDFVVDAGARPVEGSTIYDLSGDASELVRERMGPRIPELEEVFA